MRIQNSLSVATVASVIDRAANCEESVWLSYRLSHVHGFINVNRVRVRGKVGSFPSARYLSAQILLRGNCRSAAHAQARVSRTRLDQLARQESGVWLNRLASYLKTAIELPKNCLMKARERARTRTACGDGFSSFSKGLFGFGRAMVEFAL
jgi:hypothetical protein